MVWAKTNAKKNNEPLTSVSIPRTSKPKVYTLPSNDFPAGDFVLPTEDNIKKYHITVQYTDINCEYMDNEASKV